MTYFKFLHGRDVKHIMSGSLRLGNLQYYRLLEILTENDFIGDKNDGRREHPFADIDTPHLKMTNCKGVSTAAGFAFCYAQGEYDRLASEFSKTRPGIDAYDSCIEIIDPERLARGLRQGVGNGAFAGRAVNDLGEVVCGPITYYDDSSINPGQVVERADGFQKDLKYAAQAEVRMLLKHESNADFIDVMIPEPEKVFKIVNVGSSAPELPPPSPSLAWQDMSDCLAELGVKWATDPRADTTKRWRGREEEFERWDNWFSTQIDPIYRGRLYAAYLVTRKERRSDRLDRRIINGQSASQIYRDFTSYFEMSPSLFFDQEGI